MAYPNTSQVEKMHYIYIFVYIESTKHEKKSPKNFQMGEKVITQKEIITRLASTSYQQYKVSKTKRIFKFRILYQWQL